MARDRLYSSWIATLALLVIVWLAAGPGNVTTTIEEQVDGTGDDAEEPLPLAGKTIVIDPGHGGHNRALGDLGTVGVGPQPEKDNTLQVARTLAALLSEAGAEVVLTRTTDVNPAQDTPFETVPSGQLLARVDIAHRSGGDVFVSIHNDWHPDPSVSGATTYYYHAHSEPLARSVHEALVETVGTVDRGVRRKGFMVVRDVPMPSILVETGYLSHPDEAYAMADPAVQQKIAKGLYEGIVRYFTAS